MDKIMAGLYVMSRDDLMKFAVTSLETIERLEILNKQFKEDLEASGTVDVEIIWKWRNWLDTMGAERDEWATMATNLSVENRQLKAENAQLIDRAEKILKTLDDISRYVNVQVDGNKPPSFLLGVIQRIKKAVDSGKSNILEYFADEPIEGIVAQEPPESVAHG